MVSIYIKRGCMEYQINRRRAPSSAISSEKKRAGHQKENEFATLISGEVLQGTQKADVKDQNQKLYSVKSGKKWQVFLYSYARISNSTYLNILKPCVESFPSDINTYFEDRHKCIQFKEQFIEKKGVPAGKNLTNSEVIKALGTNSYIESKYKLAKATMTINNILKDKEYLYNFLKESIFNNDEVNYLAVKRDDIFEVFEREEVLKILCEKLSPGVSKAGRVSVDFNVDGQKVLLRYQKNNGQKNIVEIEVRNESTQKYRTIRFNMYSKDALYLLTNDKIQTKEFGNKIIAYGEAIQNFSELFQ